MTEPTIRPLGEYEPPVHGARDRQVFEALVRAHGEVHDFAAWLTELVAGVTAHVGGIDELIASRPGSWEASHVEDWMRAAGCDMPEMLDQHAERWRTRAAGAKLPEHREHEPYLKAVADALGWPSGGDIDVSDVVANPDDPRDGFISISYHSGQAVGCGEDDEFVLSWNEERGWGCGIDREQRGHVQYPYEPVPQLPVLAAPSQVAEWCRRMLADGIQAHARMATGLRLREQDDSDQEFERELAEYATARQ